MCIKQVCKLSIYHIVDAKIIRIRSNFTCSSLCREDRWAHFCGSVGDMIDKLSWEAAAGEMSRVK